MSEAASSSGGRGDLAPAIAILGLSIVGNATVALMQLLISGMSEYLGYSDTYLGNLAGATSAGAAITTVASLFFLDRVGWPLRRTVLAAMLVFAATNLARPLFFGQPAILPLIFFVGGCCAGLIWAASATAVTTLHDNPRLVAIFYGTPYLTGLAIQPFLPSLYARWGVDSAFELIGVAALLSLLLIGWFPPRTRYAQSEAVEPESGTAKRHGGGWLVLLPIAIALLFQYAANSGLWVYFDRIGALAGHSHQASANVVALGSGMALVGTILAATFARRLRTVPAIAVISLLMALATLGLLGARNYLAFAGSIFAFNAMITFITPLYFILLSHLPVSPGRAVLVGNLAMMSGFAAGPFLVGRMVGIGDFTLAIYGTCAMFVVSAAIVVGDLALARKR